MVEDSQAGVRAAKAAGMKCIGYAPEDATKQDLSLADRVIHSFLHDVPKYIADI